MPEVADDTVVTDASADGHSADEVPADDVPVDDVPVDDRSVDDPSAVPTEGDPGSLVSLLGEQRATIVERLRADGGLTAADLAEHLDISEVATRRHLGVLEEEGFITSRTVKQGRGRPAAHYDLTPRARDLFPQRYAEVAEELLQFITSEHGREGLRSYLRWRLRRQTDRLGDVVTAEDLEERLEQLAEALSAAGYEATVESDGQGFTLRQDNCAIYDVARHHPEMCSYEAAGFAQALGSDVTVSRRETLAQGSAACVCCVEPRE